MGEFKKLSKEKVDVRDKEILKKWQEMDILNATIENRKNCKNFVFYDGPIYANAKPGIHHVFADVDWLCLRKNHRYEERGVQPHLQHSFDDRDALSVIE